MKCDLYQKKILIAGGTGFIGKRLVAHLASEGANLYVISRKHHDDSKNIKYIQCDLNNSEDINAINEHFDACVYMAANIPQRGQKKETYSEAKESTLDPSIHFFDTFVKNTKKLIYISSIDVLGECDTEMYNECATPKNATPYGLAKYCGEYYAEAYCRMNNCKCTILRFSQVYGPSEPIVRIIPIMKEAILSEKTFSIYTDGEEKRRFLYVDDAVESICLALKMDASGIYNIAGKDVSSIRELAIAMEEVYSKKLNLEILNQFKGKNNIPSIAKAESELGYRPKYSLVEGLKLIKEEEEQC